MLKSHPRPLFGRLYFDQDGTRGTVRRDYEVEDGVVLGRESPKVSEEKKSDFDFITILVPGRTPRKEIDSERDKNSSERQILQGTFCMYTKFYRIF